MPGPSSRHTSSANESEPKRRRAHVVDRGRGLQGEGRAQDAPLTLQDATNGGEIMNHVKRGIAVAVVASLFQADVAGHRPIRTEPVDGRVGSPLAARVETAGKGQPAALTVRRVYDVDRAVRATMRRFRRGRAGRRCGERVRGLSAAPPSGSPAPATRENQRRTVAKIPATERRASAAALTAAGSGYRRRWT